jgi:hypothetical protein
MTRIDLELFSNCIHRLTAFLGCILELVFCSPLIVFLNFISSTLTKFDCLSYCGESFFRLLKVDDVPDGPKVLDI